MTDLSVLRAFIRPFERAAFELLCAHRDHLEMTGVTVERGRFVRLRGTATLAIARRCASVLTARRVPIREYVSAQFVDREPGTRVLLQSFAELAEGITAPGWSRWTRFGPSGEAAALGSRFVSTDLARLEDAMRTGSKRVAVLRSVRPSLSLAETFELLHDRLPPEYVAAHDVFLADFVDEKTAPLFGGAVTCALRAIEDTAYALRVQLACQRTGIG